MNAKEVNRLTMYSERCESRVRDLSQEGRAFEYVLRAVKERACLGETEMYDHWSYVFQYTDKITSAEKRKIVDTLIEMGYDVTANRRGLIVKWAKGTE